MCLLLFTVMERSPAPFSILNRSQSLYVSLLLLADKLHFLPSASLAVILPNFLRGRRENEKKKKKNSVICRENMCNCRHLPYGPAWDKLFLFCSSQHIKVLRVVKEPWAIFSVCLLSLDHKSGSHSTEAMQCSLKTEPLPNVWGEMSYRLPVSQPSACIVLKHRYCNSNFLPTVCAGVTFQVTFRQQCSHYNKLIDAWIENLLNGFNQTCRAGHDVSPCVAMQHLLKGF